MKSSKDRKETHQEYFHKICVVGGGLTGAIMVLLLKQSKLFKKK
jgi:glycerol-3-phosphate dehydrogenase